METLQAVRGMNDILPDEMPKWRRAEEHFRELAERFGYGEIRTPIVESTSLFVRSIGEATDIVEKEMFTFVDAGQESLTLRPEGTASAVRAYLEHTVHAREAVTKWIYLGAMFRREKPQKGRYRQFYQLGAEVFGDPGPFVDAEIIEMGVAFLRDLGVRDVDVVVNSIGSPEARKAYREALVGYLEPRRESLSDDSQRRFHKNPLRILDSKDPRDQEAVVGAPTLSEHLTSEDRQHFDDLRRTLDALSVPYLVDPKLVRGIDYYTRTLFEVRGRAAGLGAQNTIFGGGRYDDLVASLGGPSTPAIGFAIGVERLLLSMSEAAIGRPGNLGVFVVVADTSLRVEAQVLARHLRASGISVDVDLRGTSLKSQLRRADKRGARLAMILGPSEVERGVVQVKDLVLKQQHDVRRDQITEQTWKLLREPT